MKILYICHRIPYPPNKGEKIRSYHILSHLTKKNDVYLACLIDDEKDIKYVKRLSFAAKRVMYDTIDPIRKKILCCLSVGGRQPFSICYFYSPKLQKQIDELLGTVKMDLVFCSSSPTAEYLFRSRYRDHKLAKVRWIMDLIDVDSKKWSDYASKRAWPLGQMYQLESLRLSVYEEMIVSEFDQVVLVSEAEKKLLRTYGEDASITVIPNGVDCEFFNPSSVPTVPKRGPTLVFVGAMDYWPNIEGVKWFVNKVFPTILNYIPGICFYIVGNNPTADVKCLAKRKGVVVTGYVKDVREYLRAADVCVVPLLTARGIQNKILEAMAMARAVVCTPAALEGIDAVVGKEIIVGETEQDFANGVIQLLNNKQLRKKLGQEARACVKQKYSWSRSFDVLDKILSVD